MPKKKYHWTPEQDAFIKTHYNPTIRGRSTKIAQAMKLPRWSINRRARELGLSRLKEPPWTPKDTAYLGQHYHKMPIKAVARKLGRTPVAVNLKAKRLGYRKHGEGYSLNTLAQALGVDPHWVRNKVTQGTLQASCRNTNRTPQQGGDSYLITDTDVATFVKDHTFDIDLGKVDRLWFLDVVHHALNETASYG